MFTGSMVGAGPTVFSTWLYILSHSKPPGIVEVNPKVLAFLIGAEESDIEAALEFLLSPDPKSRSKEEDGRRLLREGEFQYRIVNWEKYNAIRNEEDRRQQNRIAQAKWRKRSKQASAESAASAHLDVDVPVDADAVDGRTDGVGRTGTTSEATELEPVRTVARPRLRRDS